jgi:cytochrome c oxidase subunit II
MNQLLIGLGSVLLVLVVVLLYKVATMVRVSKNKSDGPDSRSNNINGILMLLFLIAFGVAGWYSAYVYYDDYVIPVASEHGVTTDNMFWITMYITGFAFIITHILLFYYAFRYRYRKNAKATFYPDNSKLEVIWTLVPAVVLTGLILYGLDVWTDITSQAPAEAEVVEVMGMQFAWKVRYPGMDNQLGNYDYKKIDAANMFGMDLTDKNSFDDFTPREIHIPKGKPVLFNIRARDVLHSVYVPAFRLKMDAVPGMPTKFWFVPTKSTADMRAETGNDDFNYELACAEICGDGHFTMRMVVVVDEPAAYEKWKKEQKTWLSKNPEYLSQIPDELKEVALISSGIDTEAAKISEASF